jgi:hypothetical protein
VFSCNGLTEDVRHIVRAMSVHGYEDKYADLVNKGLKYTYAIDNIVNYGLLATCILYISPDTNELVVLMNTYNVINEEITIPDIPLNKWVNVIIRCQSTTLDIYINGTITRSLNLIGVPKQNYGDVYVAMNGGFGGYLSNLWYYNYALGTSAIQNLVSKGPNTKMIGGSAGSFTDPASDYLALRWFFYDINDAYN